MNTVYINGKFVPQSEANISIFDRGFLFGDSIYGVIPVYQGHAFCLKAHLQRLSNSLNAIGMHDPMSPSEWQHLVNEVIVRNGMGDQSIYVQVTRGAGTKRDHHPDPSLKPTIVIFSQPLQRKTIEALAEGCHAATVEDIRWQRCDIKTTSLLATMLIKQEASALSADEAIVIKNGYALEGASSNLFIVKNSEIITPPKGNHILGGITRDFILNLCRKNNLSHHEDLISTQTLESADEIWLTGSLKEVMPVLTLDGQTIGDGKAGPMWHKMAALYKQATQPIESHDTEEITTAEISL